MAATCERPVAAACSRYGFISMLRSAAFSGTTGMWLASANEATRRRKASPICCRLILTAAVTTLWPELAAGHQRPPLSPDSRHSVGSLPQSAQLVGQGLVEGARWLAGDFLHGVADLRGVPAGA